MSTPAAYFDALYDHSPDPWQVQTRWYERRKRDLLLAALPRARYAHAFEPGCGTGVLTRLLAERCEQVLASDCSLPAVEATRRATGHLRHVTVEQQTLPQDWPASRFDLIVVSEWGYYLGADALQALAHRCRASLTPDATLVACHWLADFDERVQPSADVHAAFHAAAGLHHLVHLKDADFVLDVWSPCPQSIAEQEGLR